MSEEDVQTAIRDYILDSGRDVPLFELILKFRAEPYNYDKRGIIRSAETLVGHSITKTYLPIKCRLIPHYRAMKRLCPGDHHESLLP